ncbi:MAG TPA: thioesterase family protein [Candidatus Nanopelagicales bacterium]|nr:thioesterase family protein [Candidatus Nanopelagicales bacterium]
MARRRFLLQLRTSDLDWMGHVNNALYAEYLMEARVDLAYDFRGGSLTLPDLATVVANQEIGYQAPLHYRPGPVAIDTWVERIGHTSYTLGHEVREPEGDVVYATARTVMVQVDKSTGKPRNIGDPFRLYLELFVDPDGPA